MPPISHLGVTSADESPTEKSARLALEAGFRPQELGAPEDDGQRTSILPPEEPTQSTGFEKYDHQSLLHLIQFEESSESRCCMIMLGEEDLQRIHAEFLKQDVNCSGALDEEEMQNLWREIFPHMPIAELREMSDALYQDLDPNRDGFVSWPEFEGFFRNLHNRDHWNDVDWLVNGMFIAREATRKETVWQIVDINTVEYESIQWYAIPLQKFVWWLSNIALLVSIGVIIMESEVEYRDLGVAEGGDILSKAIYPFEVVCMLIFTFEFLLRGWSSPPYVKYWRNFHTWVEIASILPFYIGAIDDRGEAPMKSMGQDTPGDIICLRMIRLARVCRVLRLLRVGRQFEIVQVLLISIGRMMKPLCIALIGVQCGTIVFLSGIICVAERHQATFDLNVRAWVRDNDSYYEDAGKEIPFQKLAPSMWWAVTTVTTVGYGDLIPLTRPGKCIAGLGMMAGVVLMAFPLTLLSNSFSSTMEEMARKKQTKKRAQSFSAKLRRARLLNELGARMQRMKEYVKQRRGEGSQAGGAARRAPPPKVQVEADPRDSCEALIPRVASITTAPRSPRRPAPQRSPRGARSPRGEEDGAMVKEDSVAELYARPFSKSDGKSMEEVGMRRRSSFFRDSANSSGGLAELRMVDRDPSPRAGAAPVIAVDDVDNPLTAAARDRGAADAGAEPADPNGAALPREHRRRAGRRGEIPPELLASLDDTRRALAQIQGVLGQHTETLASQGRALERLAERSARQEDLLKQLLDDGVPAIVARPAPWEAARRDAPFSQP